MAEMLDQFRERIEQVSPRRYLQLLVLFAALIFLAGLNSRWLYGSDEPRVAGIATEIAVYGNWVTPALNGKPFLEKPPLYLWANAVSQKLFGFTPGAAKLPSALSAIGGVLAVFALARAMGLSGFGSFMAGVILATSAQYWNNGRKCMIDMMLAAFIIGVFWTFFQLLLAKSRAAKMAWFIGLTLTLAGALFSKGLVGVAIPGVAIGGWLCVRDIANRKFSPAAWLQFAAAVLLAFIPVSIWVWLLYRQSGYDAVYTVVWTNNFGRFTGSHAEHIEPFYYYLLKLPGQFQPWLQLLPFAIYYNIRRFITREYGKKESAYSSLYLLCWLIIPYLLLHISAGKRQVYLLPLYGAAAIMTGMLIDDFIAGKLFQKHSALQRLIVRHLAWALPLATLLLPIILLVINIIQGSITLPAIILGLMGLSLALFAFQSWRAGDLTNIVSSAILALLLGFVTVDMTIRTAGSRRYAYRNAFAYCRQQLQSGKNIVLYCPTERLSGAALFYLRTRLESGRSVEWVNRQLLRPNTIVVVSDRYLQLVKKQKKSPKLLKYAIVKGFKQHKGRLLLIIAAARNKLPDS